MPTDSIKIERGVPTFSVENAVKAIEYYCSKLGFTLDWDDAVVGHDHVMYASLSRGDCQICVSEHPPKIGPQGAWCYVSDARALEAEFKASGALMPKGGIEEMPWGEIELDIRDPDGNGICFTQRAPKKT